MEKIFDINYLKSTPEDQHFDRKSARIKPKDILRHLVAFANAEGGHLVLQCQKIPCGYSLLNLLKSLSNK